ncbi:hypothetical protein OIDMADRAFT_29778 [Oidiodendron maius Zn]|uniref:Protein kinase domain-containing protein n=1 Tax=Oidiodendron maius (strain Zn) TaxID=913774 RepID=A0A0C3HEG8_OIDMZ|nr:hypothetical protein OIDMADRAFT_29778 [Oidiodendron maius Zn]
MVEPIGTVGLTIAIIDDGVKVLNFVLKWIDDAKHYGEHVRIFKTRLATEIARLQTLSDFLGQKSDDGVYRFEELPSLSQRAVKGMIQEFQTTLSSYSMLVSRYKIESLQRGYESKGSSKDDALSMHSPLDLEAAGAAESKNTQDEASWIRVAAWGLFQKKKIMALIKELTDWNSQLQCLLIKNLGMSTGVTLQKLVAENTTAGPELFPNSWALQKLRLPDIDSRLQILVNGDQRQSVFVEYKAFEKEPSKVFVERMERLGKLLSVPKVAENGFNTLQCIGIIRQDSPSKRFAFVFQLPIGLPEPTLNMDNLPIDLSQVVTSSTLKRPTLGQKFKLARALAETVFQFHSANWLHKSIRSENVLLWCRSTAVEYSKPYLVGFEFSRDEKDRSTTEQDDILARNIFRHPDRHGPPEERFTSIHDIYALGVTLLEIGVWRPVLEFDRSFGQKTPAEIKLCLESHARERLPHYMGTAYMTAVLHCLQGSLLESEERSDALGKLWGDTEREQVQMSLREKVIGNIDTGDALE